MKKLCILFCLIVLIIPTCKIKETGNSNWHIELPETKSPQSINQWAINKYPFIKLRQEPDESSKIIFYLPMGAVIKVLKKNNQLTSFDSENNYWYNIDYEGESGWIFGSFIEVFNTYEEAVKRSEEIILGDKK